MSDEDYLLLKLWEEFSIPVGSLNGMKRIPGWNKTLADTFNHLLRKRIINKDGIKND